MKRLSSYFKFGFLTIAFFIAVSATSASAQKGPLGQILDRMDAHYKGLSTLRTNVVMVKTDAALGAGGNETLNGTVNFVPERKPKAMAIRVDWLKPKESMIVIKDDYRLINFGTKVAICGKRSDTKTNAKVAGPLSFLGMSREQLKANYDVVIASKDEVTLSDGTRAIHLRLTPKTKNEYKVAELWVDGDGMPRQAMVVSNNGDTTTILMKAPEKNISLDGNIFTLALPNGMKCTKA